MATTTATLFAVRVNARRCDDGAPRAHFFGHEPTLYRTEASADARVAELETTGEWGEQGRPTYYVEEVNLSEMHPAERRDFDRAIIGA